MHHEITTQRTKTALYVVLLKKHNFLKALKLNSYNPKILSSQINAKKNMHHVFNMSQEKNIYIRIDSDKFILTWCSMKITFTFIF